MGKVFVSLDALIGEEFGSLFEVSGSPPRLQKRKRCVMGLKNCSALSISH